MLEANSRQDYREQLEKELKEVADSEMWQAGAQVRALRPERQGRNVNGSGRDPAEWQRQYPAVFFGNE